MIIHQMTDDECRTILTRSSVGRLGCTQDDQPYVLPISLVYDADYFYVLATLGQKIEWMRTNSKVCVQVDEIESDSKWISVIANGRYQELPDPQFADERAHARKLLQKRHHWWETALAERQLKAGDKLIDPIFFRIHIDSVTGLRAESE